MIIFTVLSSSIDQNDIETPDCILIPEFYHSSPLNEILKIPLQYFKKTIYEDFLSLIVNQSHLYSCRRNSKKPLNLSKNDLEQWVSMGLGLANIFQ